MHGVICVWVVCLFVAYVCCAFVCVVRDVCKVFMCCACAIL